MLWLWLAVGVQPAAADDYYFGDSAGTVVAFEEDALSLLLPGGQRAWRTGDVMIRADAAALDAIEALTGVAYLEDLHGERDLYKVVGGRGVDEVALSRAIFDLPGVTFAVPDFELELVPHTLNDPYIDNAWHLNNTGQSGGLPGADSGAFNAWNVATGDGIVIAIIDTGVDTTHPDLDLVTGYDFGDGDADVTPEPEQDGYNHGTAMAGVAAAIGNNGVGVAGVAPDAQIMPIKIIGDGATRSDIYLSFVYAVDNGASVLSNSWGYRVADCGPVPLTPELEEAFDYAAEEGRNGLGAAIPMSLGNSGCDAGRDDMHAHPAITSVGAIGDRDERIGYSNYGQHLNIMGFAGGDGRPTLWSTDMTGELGSNTAEDGDYYSGASGTSSACASIAGVYAILFEANPRLTAVQAKQVLCDTAVKPAWEEAAWDENGWSPLYGCGRVDANAAVLTVVNGAPSVELDVPADQFSDQIRLTWAGTDPDEDALQYRLVITYGDFEEPEFEALLDEPYAVLDNELIAGATYGWTVTPVDQWGDGETVIGTDFAVVLPEEEPKGACSAVQGSAVGSVWLVIFGVLGLRRRR
ncbi:MAG: S8 family serine peptidase [Myxococcota bacterium]